MTTRETTDAESSAPAAAFVDRPLFVRLRRGGGWGLLVGGVWALIEAAFANWGAGLAFNKYSPPGDPLGLTLAVALLTPPLVGAIGGVLAPLFRTRKGTIAVGVLSAVPMLIGGAILATTRSSAPWWQSLMFLIAFFVFGGSMALDIRNDVLGVDQDAPDTGRDRPHN